MGDTMAYRNIIVKTKGENEECFDEIQKRLCLYDRFIIPNGRKKMLLCVKDDKKSVYSIDAGGITTELNAALLAIRYYLADYQKHVEICVQ